MWSAFASLVLHVGPPMIIVWTGITVAVAPIVMKGAITITVTITFLIPSVIFVVIPMSSVMTPPSFSIRLMGTIFFPLLFSRSLWSLCSFSRRSFSFPFSSAFLALSTFSTSWARSYSLTIDMRFHSHRGTPCSHNCDVRFVKCSIFHCFAVEGDHPQIIARSLLDRNNTIHINSSFVETHNNILTWHNCINGKGNWSFLSAHSRNWKTQFASGGQHVVKLAKHELVPWGGGGGHLAKTVWTKQESYLYCHYWSLELKALPLAWETKDVKLFTCWISSFYLLGSEGALWLVLAKRPRSDTPLGSPHLGWLSPSLSQIWWLQYWCIWHSIQGQGNIIGSVQAQTLGQALQDTTVCIDRDQIVSTWHEGPNSFAINL